MENNHQIDLRQILGVFSTYKWSILAITLLFTAMVAAYAYLLKPMFHTSTLVSIEHKKALTLESLLPGSAGAAAATSALDTNIRILKSRKIISRVLDKIDLTKTYYKCKTFRGFIIKRIPEDRPPFEVIFMDRSGRMSGKYITIIQTSKDTYLLHTKEPEIEKEFRFGQLYKTPDFMINVVKRRDFEEIYQFTYNADKLSLINGIITNLKITKPTEDLLEIGYTDFLPLRAKKIVDEIAKIYIDYNLKSKMTENEKLLQFVDTRLQFIRKTLKRYGEKLKSFQEENTQLIANKESGELFNRMVAQKEQLTKLQYRLKELEKLRFKRKIVYADIMRLASTGISTAQFDSWMEKLRQIREELSLFRSQSRNWTASLIPNAELQAKIELYNEKLRRLRQLRRDFTPLHPQVQALQKEIAFIRQSIRNFLSSNIRKLESQAYTLEREIENTLQVLYRQTKKSLGYLEQKVSHEEQLLKSLPGANLELSDLKRNFVLTEKIYTFLLQKRMEVEINKASTIANTKVIDPALVPTKPFKPNKKMMVAAGFLVGLILGVAIAFLRAMLDTKVHNKEELEKLTDIPLYGVIPIKEKERVFRESFITVRTNLHFIIPHHKNCKIIMVSSSVPKEGKTTISSGLAHILARTERKVLALDLDMRKPRMHQEFARPNNKGMSTYLAGEHTFEEALQPISTHLDFFPAGPVAPNPSELLMSEKFKKTLDMLVGRYEYIVIDTSPIGVVADASLLLQYIDLMLLVVRANYTEKNHVRDFEKMAREKQIKSVGIILNGVKRSQKDSYGYGYGYGYEYR